jgi:hypothetical protein
MPYICVESNRYIGEHSCSLYHYGDESMVRPCCVEDCKGWAQTAMRVASTTAHPAYRLYRAAWNSLTLAEMRLCPHFTITYHGEILHHNQMELF